MSSLPTDFKKLLSARFFYTFGVQMQAVILGWRNYELLQDPLALGLIGLTEAVPAIGLALYAGYLVDRMRPLKAYRYVIYISLLSGIMVLLEHLLEEHLSLTAQVTMLYSASFLTGLARAFSQPSIFAAVPRLVERSKLMQAAAMTSSTMQVARIVGPAFGGIVFGFLGAVMASSLVCAALIISTICMTLIKKDIPPPETIHQHKSTTEELLSGVKFVFKHPILFPAMLLDMIAVMFGGVTALLPIFASDILMVGAKGLGVLRAAPAIGAAVMGFYLFKKTVNKRSGTWLLWAMTGFGVCILIFGYSTNFYLSFFALLFSGAFDSINMIIRGTAVQLASPDHMRGRVSAVNSIFIGSSNEIGELESGIAAKIFGTVPAVYFGGIICLVTVACVSYLSPALRKMELDKIEA
jgi:MFS family permease